jgi:hypothetical protein
MKIINKLFEITIAKKPCITLRIAGFLDFFHRPVIYELENITFRKIDLFTSSGVGRNTPEDGKISSFRNVVFF